MLCLLDLLPIICYIVIVKYFGELPKWLRGHPAKVLGRETGARVQISYSPPLVNCTHPNKQLGCVFFYLHECFGIVMPFEKPKIENPSHLNYLHIKRDAHGNFCK